VVTLAAAWACGGGSEPQLSAAAQRGRATYLNVCVACHNANPALDGSLGPNLVGATRELLEWRVVRGSYPPGYQPKREGNAMPSFPHLAGQIDDLAAFVAESTGGGAAPD
jgi:mono/diheme cytochrome c family protein